MSRRLVLLTVLAALLVAPIAAHAAAPANDNFASSEAISGSTGSAPGTTTESTVEENEPCYAGCAATVWYSWTGPRGDLTLTIDTVEFNPNIAIYTGGGLPVLTVEQATNESSLTFPVLEDVTYRIQLNSDTSDVVGAFTLSWTEVLAPANDDFDDATEISGSSGSTDGDTDAATVETSEPCYAGCQSTVWYRWRAPFAGTVAFGTTNTNFDASLGVYQGNNIADLLVLGADNDEGNGTNPLVSFTAEDGVLYRIQIVRQGSTTGNFRLNWFPGYRPDAQLKLGSASFVGNNIYSSTAVNEVVSTGIAAGSKKTFTIKVQNDGTVVDGYKVKGPATGSGWKIKYLAGTSGTTNITSAVTGGSYSLNNIAVGSAKSLRMIVTRTATAGSNRSLLVTAKSKAEPTRKDAVKAIARV